MPLSRQSPLSGVGQVSVRGFSLLPEGIHRVLVPVNGLVACVYQPSLAVTKTWSDPQATDDERGGIKQPLC